MIYLSVSRSTHDQRKQLHAVLLSRWCRFLAHMVTRNVSAGWQA